jgi:hypothetical protein
MCEHLLHQKENVQQVHNSKKRVEFELPSVKLFRRAPIEEANNANKEREIRD